MARAVAAGLALALVGGCPAPEPDDGLHAVVVTFNSGTSEAMGHDSGPDDGYSGQHAEWSDLYYGDGLAWSPAVDATRDFFADLAPDVVVFQEIFHPADCPDIPAEAQADFICADWQPGDPTVAQEVLGDGWQVMCHPGNTDKCAAVRRTFGSFVGCDDDLCLEGLHGLPVDGCGNGSRVARGVIELASGDGELTLVNVHGNSGLGAEEKDCRAAGVEQIFVDQGDGQSAVRAAPNLVLGDLNTDPGRWQNLDVSAERWNDFVGDGLDFAWLTPVGPDVPPTYNDLVNIDHVAADSLAGDCFASGMDDPVPTVIDAVYFDHRPIVCEVWEQGREPQARRLTP